MLRLLRAELIRTVLELQGVVRTFGEVTALAEVDLQVGRGEVVGLLGHNGAGKTTTVRVLAGLLAPHSGSVSVAGLDPLSDGPTVRRRLGVLPARPVVDLRMTAADNLRFAADVFDLPRGGLTQRILGTLETFDLLDRAEERVSSFSTGMRQRLSLARVLLPDPEILLLDEPTASLDPIAARQVRRSISSLAQEHQRTVVLCTHDLVEADQLCDRVVVLENGQVVADDSPATLAARHGTGGVQLDVAAEHVDAARRALAAVGANDVQVDGVGRLRASGVPRDAVPALVGRLAEAQVTIYEVRRTDAALEDVYLALHGQRSDLPETGSGGR